MRAKEPGRLFYFSAVALGKWGLTEAGNRILIQR
jgi:hypothetical protein